MHLVVKLGLCLGLFVACVPTSPSPPLPSVIASSASPSSSATASPSPAIYPSLSPTPLPEIRVSDAQVVAGTGEKGFRDGPALQASFNQLTGMCYAHKTQDLYILDTNMVRKLSKDGVITTVAGSPEAGFRDGEPMQARFNLLMDCAVTENGDLYLADFRNQRIRRFSLQNGVTTIAGGSNSGLKDGLALESELLGPESLTFANHNKLYFSDRCWVRVLQDGVISTLNRHQSRCEDYMRDQEYNAYDGAISTQAIFGDGLVLSEGLNNIYISDLTLRQFRRLNQDQTVTSLLKKDAEGVSYGDQVRDVDFLPEKNLLVMVVGNRLAVMNTATEPQHVPFLPSSTKMSKESPTYFEKVTVGSEGLIHLMSNDNKKIYTMRFLD
jgi:hypothetical protein